MADRTSAELFGVFFEFLAKNPTEENKEMAEDIYERIRDYDFSPDQMGCDDELITLGLAKIIPDPDCETNTIIEYNEIY